jgi:hypothetical protein
MRMNAKNVELANELRAIIQARSKTIDDGEGVAIVLLWSFLQDHALCHGIDVEPLAREQLEAFIQYARENMRLEKVQ